MMKENYVIVFDITNYHNTINTTKMCVIYIEEWLGSYKLKELVLEQFPYVKCHAILYWII